VRIDPYLLKAKSVFRESLYQESSYLIRTISISHGPHTCHLETCSVLVLTCPQLEMKSPVAKEDITNWCKQYAKTLVISYSLRGAKPSSSAQWGSERLQQN
jgi:hypothetical protein